MPTRLATRPSDAATPPAAGAPDASPLVSVRGLSKVYHRRKGDVVALRNVSLDVGRGEMLVLLGPSGCGKTTLLRSIAGLEHPTEGEITVHGRTVFSSARDLSLPPERRGLSMVFQSYALWPHMTVLQNVSYPLRVTRVRDPELTERATRALALVGLEKYATHYPGQMSGGQQQRVALARALVANDGLILFDEPLSNLDAKVRERLRDELIAMQHELGFTGIYVTHDQIEAAALADRIAVMEVGQVAQLGDPTEVFNTPQSRYVADFVGCTNVLPGTVSGGDGELVLVDTVVGPIRGVATVAGMVAGQTVRVMFRPEHGRLVHDGAAQPDGAAPDGAASNTVTGQVEQSLFLGSHIEYRLDASGHRVLFRSMDDEPLHASGTITVRINPALVRVFPGD